MTQTLKPHPQSGGPGADIIWEGPHDRVVLSPRHGGRVVAWSHRGSANLVREPQQFEGGLLRTMLRAEGYPGTSYSTPHLVVPGGEKPNSVHLRYFWDTPNIFARLFGWSEKICPRYLDGLLLDKVVTFHPETSALSVALTITNVSGGPRRIVPWVQNTFRETLGDFSVVRDGVREGIQTGRGLLAGTPGRLRQDDADGAGEPGGETLCRAWGEYRSPGRHGQIRPGGFRTRVHAVDPGASLQTDPPRRRRVLAGQLFRWP